MPYDVSLRPNTTCAQPAYPLHKRSLSSLCALCTEAARLVRRFLKFQGPLSGQNQYVANNYTLTQPQGVRHVLLQWKRIMSCAWFKVWSLLCFPKLIHFIQLGR